MVLPVPVVEEHNGVLVVRDDLLPGGTKMRAIMPLIESSSAIEFVYASPAQGYAQVALAYCAALAGRRATVFTAARKAPHPLTIRAQQAGAKIIPVAFGRLGNVQAKARTYAQQHGAFLVPFGCEDPRCMMGISEAARSIGIDPAEVWSVAGSGVLTRSLQHAWPDADFHAVVVGKANIDTGRAKRIIHPQPFEHEADMRPPFPSASTYDAKAWCHVIRRQDALFWNVGA